MAKKKHPLPPPPPPPSSGSTGGAYAAQVVYLPTAVDFRNWGLAVPPKKGGFGPGSAVDVSNATGFAGAMENMASTNPNMFNALATHFGFPTTQELTSDPSLRTGLASQLDALFKGAYTTAAKGSLAFVDPETLPHPTNTAYVNSSGNAAYTYATASAEADSYSEVQNDLDAWGLDSLLPQVTKMIFSQGVANFDEVLNWVRNTPQYAQQFPGLKEHNASLGPGSEHMTEQDYMTLTQSYLGVSQQFGLPSGFLDKQEIGKLVTDNVSAADFSQRVQDVYTAIANASPNTLTDLQNWYGVSPGQAAAYALNPGKALPFLQRQVASATIGGYATSVGLTGLGEKGAEQLAQLAKLTSTTGNQPLAVGTSTIESGLLSASRNVGLTKAAPGANVPTLDTNTLIGSQIAGFGGTNQLNAQTDVERAGSARVGAFSQGGGFEQSGKGGVDVGGAPT